MRSNFIVMLTLAAACGAPQIAGTGGGAGGATGTGGGGTGGGTGGGGAGAGDSGNQIVGGCPRVLLGSTLPAEFSGDTANLPNLVTSARLEWTDAPDDALEFTAPSAGQYLIELTGSNSNLGASAEDYNTTGSDAFPFTRAACPAAGAVKEINGTFTYNQPNYPISLSAGQKMIVFISAPYWAASKTGNYTLKVSKKP
jgi:hypothetical protein